MARAIPDLARRAITLDTGRRSIDLPVDGTGRVRRVAHLDQRSIVRAGGADDAIGFRGHAAVFNKRTWIGSKRWGFWEEIAPTAFAKTIGEADVRMLINHDPNLILARNKAGTLRLSIDEVGLLADADMAPTSYARDLAISLERGDVSQMSFAFDMVDYEWSEMPDGSELLRHTEVALWDVAPVTYPAYTEAEGGLRMDLLAVARSAGFDALDIERLGRRLADPDPDLLAGLRALARGDVTPAETTSPQGPPAETTGTTPTRTGLDHVERRMSLMKEKVA